MPRLLSVNVGLPRDVTWNGKTARTSSRPVADYTPRLVPRHVEAFVPLEAPFILWHEAPF
jgi:hypothetical protein